MLEKFFARQLALPSGLIGRMFTARWLDRANATMNKIALQQLAITDHDRVLEVGFGGGHLLTQILTTEPCEFVAGVDLSAAMVQRGQRRLRNFIRDGQAAVKRGDIEALPFPDAEFTKLVSVNTLYFWRNPDLALRQCRRVLRPRGQIVLCFNAKQDLQTWPIHKHGFRLYELPEVEELLRAAGFSNLQSVSANDKKQGSFYCVSGFLA